MACVAPLSQARLSRDWKARRLSWERSQSFAVGKSRVRLQLSILFPVTAI